MTALHMQTETVRSVAKQMLQTGEQTVLTLQSLSRTVQEISSKYSYLVFDGLTKMLQNIRTDGVNVCIAWDVCTS